MKKLLFVIVVLLMQLIILKKANCNPCENDTCTVCAEKDENDECISWTTESESGNYGCYLGEYKEVVAKSNGGWTGTGCGEYQCVEYVKRFYSDQYEVSIGTVGVAQNMYSKAKDFGLYAYPNKGNFRPEPGNYLVFGHSNGIGHVAIITNVTETNVEIIEQNWSSSSCTGTLSITSTDGKYEIANRGSYYIIGWVSPFEKDITYFTFPNASSQGWICGYDTEEARESQYDEWRIHVINNPPYTNPGIISPEFSSGIMAKNNIIKFSAKVTGNDIPVNAELYVMHKDGNWANSVSNITIGTHHEYREYKVDLSQTIGEIPINDLELRRFSLELSDGENGDDEYWYLNWVKIFSTKWNFSDSQAGWNIGANAELADFFPPPPNGIYWRLNPTGKRPQIFSPNLNNVSSEYKKIGIRYSVKEVDGIIDEPPTKVYFDTGNGFDSSCSSQSSILRDGITKNVVFDIPSCATNNTQKIMFDLFDSDDYLNRLIAIDKILFLKCDGTDDPGFCGSGGGLYEPEDLTAIPISQTQIILSWTRGLNPPEYQNLEYRIYRQDTDISSTYNPIDTSVNTSYSDDSLQPNSLFCYKVSAFMDNDESALSTKSCAITLNENPATLTSIEITGPIQVNENSTTPYACTAYYSDGSTSDVTAGASWSENSSYASINSSGYLTTSSVPSDQSCTIDVSYGGKTDTHVLTILDSGYNPPSITNIRIEGPIEVRRDSTENYVAYAEYSDGHEEDVTGSASWSVSCPSYATIIDGILITEDNYTNDFYCSITATYGGVSGQYGVTFKALDNVGYTIIVPNDYPTIQEAIHQSRENGTVIVKSGTYHENLEFESKSVTVRSESGAATTIIDGSQNDKSTVTFSINIPNTILSGFTITGGRGNYIGGGIYIGGTSPTIDNCVITGNSATSGGGIFCRYEETAPIISNCAITNNSAINGAGGGIECGEASPTITNCVISSNSALQGGGLSVGSSSPTITGCIITNNSAGNGGGIATDSYLSSAEITKCTINGNTATSYGGGIYFYGGTSYLINSIISGNYSGYDGGGVYCKGEYTNEPLITNSTISGNLAENEGGGIYYGRGGSNVINSILWGNAASGTRNEIHLRQSSSPINIIYSNTDRSYITGSGSYWWEQHSITKIPLFKDQRNAAESPTIAGDYHLLHDSPCIDKGADSSLTGMDVYSFPADDFDGDSRPQGTYYDIGADEFPLLSNINIVGPSIVDEDSSNQYDAIAFYGGLNPTTVTNNAAWSVDCAYAAINDQGNLTTSPISTLFEQCTITASYGGKLDNFDITIRTTGSCTINVPTDYNTIQEAIDVAFDGCTVLVGDGTYIENIDFNEKAIIVKSVNGPEVTIIDGSANTRGSGNGSVVDFGDGEGRDSIIDGFKITGGTGNIPRSSRQGGGIFCDHSSPIIRNCIIEQNNVSAVEGAQGGGIYCGNHSAPLIENCTIKNNSAEAAWSEGNGGGINSSGSDPTIKNCNILANTASKKGGGVYINNSPYFPDIEPPIVIDSCLIKDNMTGDDGGGIYFFAADNVIINDSVISSNFAMGTDNPDSSGGGIYSYNTQTTLTNSVITNNSAVDDGGALYETGNRKGSTLINCTLSRNSATDKGGGVVVRDYSSVVVVNSILWDNEAGSEAPEIYLADAFSTISVNYSNVEGGYIGTNNINENPYFVNADQNNYHLQNNSPCINKGTSNVVIYPDLPTHDIDGESRPQGTDNDIGADEYPCVDGDGDGYYSISGCGSAVDCDDSKANINPEASEECDGLDNDCNSTTLDGVDEVWFGTNCDGTDSDLCEEGTYQCVGGIQSCSDVSGDNLEVCDGLDNDCDGSIDEELTQATTCGIGACAGNTGEKICTSGVWGDDTCDPTAGATVETCDNVDNDCDGSVDEDLIQNTTCGMGTCAGNTGEETCIAGSWINDTCDPFAGAISETCNDIDDDCDGSIDEGLTQTTTCGIGACAGNVGEETCVAGSWINDTCNPTSGATAETCDNVDNDCDGSVDENLIQATTCGVGACTGNTGQKTCSNGSWINDTCDPFAGAAVETCNNVDDNCNGSVDEGLTQATTCGTGICNGNTGLETCIAGDWVNDTCDPFAGAVAENCNNVDDNCNGLVDEGLILSCGSDIGECQSGTQTCSTGVWGPCVGDIGPTCDIKNNGLDEDCDGQDRTKGKPCDGDPGSLEDCTNGIDDDGDDLADCFDPDCSKDKACSGGGSGSGVEKNCKDKKDNDNDGDIDCDDSDCTGSRYCP